MEVTLTYSLYVWIGFLVILVTVAYGIAKSGFRHKVESLEITNRDYIENIASLRAKLRNVSAEKYVLDGQFRSVKERYKTLETNSGEREAKLKAQVEAFCREGTVQIWEWEGYYQVIVKTFLDQTVQISGYISPLKTYQSHIFSGTIIPGEKEVKLVYSAR